MAFIAVPLSATASDVLTIEPANPHVESCLAFGAGPGSGTGNPGIVGFEGTSPYMGFIYQNIPPFVLMPGDTLAFDLGAVNDFDVEIDIALAATTANGEWQEGEAFTTIVTNTQTPVNPRGDTTIGNFEMQFTVENPYSFGGGGLIIRFSNGSDAYRADLTCSIPDGFDSQVGVVTDDTDSSGYFVRAFWHDQDGVFPWDSNAPIIIGGFQATFQNPVNVSGAILNDAGKAVSRTAVGRTIDYRLVADNSTAIDATGVEVTATLPPDVEFLGTTTTPAAAAVYNTGPPATVAWTVGNLQAGANATLDTNLRVEFAAGGETLEFTADVTAADPPNAPGVGDFSVVDVRDDAWELLADSGNGKCFVATAAYGSYLEPEVRVLRTFRDEWLLTNRAGRAFVDWYYRTSPPLAAAISQNDSARWFARVTLTPLVYAIKYPIAFVVLFLILSLALFRLPRDRRPFA